jgi:hypothetical protein
MRYLAGALVTITVVVGGFFSDYFHFQGQVAKGWGAASTLVLIGFAYLVFTSEEKDVHHYHHAGDGTRSVTVEPPADKEN